MKFRRFTASFIIFTLLLFCTMKTACAKCETSNRVISRANALISNPNETNINKYVSLMKKRAVTHGILRDYEAQADDYRSIL